MMRMMIALAALIGAGYLYAAPAVKPATPVLTPIVVFADGAETKIDGEQNPARYDKYREQNILVLNDKSVICVVQGRNKSKWWDRSAQDLLIKRSTDSGKTWSIAKMIATHGDHSICPNATVYDAKNNRLIVLYNLHDWPYHGGDKVKIKAELAKRKADGQTRFNRQFEFHSDDGGKTWSKPREITKQLASASGTSTCVFGSGEGIQLKLGKHAGRLIIPGGHFNGRKTTSQFKTVNAWISDDSGTTWRAGTPSPINGKAYMASETSMMELPDGTILLNSRRGLVAGRTRLRGQATSTDGGETWTPLKNQADMPAVSCNGSILTTTINGKPAVLASVPVTNRRKEGMVYISFDGGKTYPKKTLVVPGSFAYSSLVNLPDGTIGLCYELANYEEIHLVKFTAKWLMNNAVANTPIPLPAPKPAQKQ